MPDDSINGILIFSGLLLGLSLLSGFEMFFNNKWAQRILFGIAFALVIWISAN